MTREQARQRLVESTGRYRASRAQWEADMAAADAAGLPKAEIARITGLSRRWVITLLRGEHGTS